MASFDPNELGTKERHSLLLGAIAPRPIALVSTVDEFGHNNLSPFSFFNIFSSNPPVVIFSAARRVRDNTTKDTLHNAMQPKRVKESPVSLECEVRDVLHMGEEGGAGNLVMCVVKRMHIADDVLLEDGGIDQDAIDLVGRMGKAWWVRASGDALFELAPPKLGIGVDQIPDVIRRSTILTGNNLGQLGAEITLPTTEEVEAKKEDFNVRRILKNYTDGIELREQLHEMAKDLLENGQVKEAWKVLLIDKSAR